MSTVLHTSFSALCILRPRSFLHSLQQVHLAVFIVIDLSLVLLLLNPFCWGSHQFPSLGITWGCFLEGLFVAFLGAFLVEKTQNGVLALLIQSFLGFHWQNQTLYIYNRSCGCTGIISNVSFAVVEIPAFKLK